MTNSNHTLIHDPVCDMVVTDNTYVTEHAGLKFLFCSRQCLERFQANPELYIGHAGEPAPRQRGEKIIKQRIFKLTDRLTDKQISILRKQIMKMMGIQDILFEGEHICIRYDLLQATAQQIETTIKDAGDLLGDGWGNKLRRAFIHYLEETELDNLAQQQTSKGQGCH